MCETYLSPHFACDNLRLLRWKGELSKPDVYWQGFAGEHKEELHGFDDSIVGTISPYLVISLYAALLHFSISVQQ